jgi:hypothetical protein
LLINRARLGMEHGVWHLLGDDPPNLADAWLLIRLWNDDGQPLTVERVGLSVVPMWVHAERQLVVIEPEITTRVEIQLEGAQIDLQPGGPSHTFYGPLLGLIRAGLDVLDSPASTRAMTSNRKEWHGELHPVVPPRASEPFRAEIRRLQDEVGIPAVVSRLVGLPNECGTTALPIVSHVQDFTKGGIGLAARPDPSRLFCLLEAQD